MVFLLTILYYKMSVVIFITLNPQHRRVEIIDLIQDFVLM